MVKCTECMFLKLLMENRYYCKKIDMIINDNLAAKDIPCNFYIGLGKTKLRK